MEQLGIIMQVLEGFGAESGQKINIGKSMLLCSNNVSEDLTAALSTASGIPTTMDIGLYLGVPIIHGRVKRSSTYDHILIKMRKKVAKWKAKSLSLAGWVTLA